MLWSLGTLKPGNEQNIELELMPTDEGEIGSVATVHFRAEASVRTIATKPMLEMEVEGPRSVMKGQQVLVKIKISNPGSGAATGVTLSETVPQGLTHPAGQELEFDVGTLKPGESRTLELSLVAAEAGIVTNVITATGDANSAPKPTPSWKSLPRNWKSALQAPNGAISSATPRTTSRSPIPAPPRPRISNWWPCCRASCNSSQPTTTASSIRPRIASIGAWKSCRPRKPARSTLTTLPLAAGRHQAGHQDRGHSRTWPTKAKKSLSIEGLAALNFQLSDASDPIEVNGQNVYEVKVTNQGTKAASNVQLVALLPPEMKAVSAEGPVRYRIEGQRIVFEPLKQLGAKAEATYKVTTQALQPGDLRLQVQISTDEIREPITKEESTRVFGNE